MLIFFLNFYISPSSPIPRIPPDIHTRLTRVSRSGLYSICVPALYRLTSLSMAWVPQSISFQFFPLPFCTHRCGLVFLPLSCITCTSFLGNLCACFFPRSRISFLPIFSLFSLLILHPPSICPFLYFVFYSCILRRTEIFEFCSSLPDFLGRSLLLSLFILCTLYFIPIFTYKRSVFFFRLSTCMATRLTHIPIGLKFQTVFLC